MKYQVQHRGKWVAVYREQIIAAADTLKTLQEKINIDIKNDELKFTLVPKGFVAG